jgi:Na+/phosphate symporter|tara:strand:- start:952 stop:1167 length:216 start_codon:yes stop_codon:yes gene_type:complete
MKKQDLLKIITEEIEKYIKEQDQITKASNKEAEETSEEIAELGGKVKVAVASGDLEEAEKLIDQMKRIRNK